MQRFCWLIVVPVLGCGLTHTSVAKDPVENDAATPVADAAPDTESADALPDTPDVFGCRTDADCEGNGVVCLFSEDSCDSRVGTCVYDECSDPTRGLDCDAFPVYCSCSGETIDHTWGSKVTTTQLGEPFAHLGSCLAEGECRTDNDCEGDGVVCLFAADSCDSRVGTCVYDECSDPTRGLECDAFPVYCSCSGETIDRPWGSKVTATQLGEPFAHFGACPAEGQCWTDADCTGGADACVYAEAGCGPGFCFDTRTAGACDGVERTYCGCDGATFNVLDGCAPRNHPWTHEGICLS